MLPNSQHHHQYQYQQQKQQTEQQQLHNMEEILLHENDDDSKGNANADENDEFYDAASELDDFKEFEMGLDIALEEAQLAISYFFNNKFDEARNLMQPYIDKSMYHSMGHAVFLFLEAILTFEQSHITSASAALKNCLDICEKHRKKRTITDVIGKQFKRMNYSQLTDLESHAELCYAEVLLLKTLLNFIEDETLTSFITGGLKIRSCYNGYKECAQILMQRNWSTKASKTHFESGVRMGLGTFNLMISLLPSSVIKILNFIGFSGNKAAGLEDLNAGYRLTGLRQVLCAMGLLGYHLIVSFILSHQDGDLILCNEILEQQLQQYPNSVWFLFFKGRLEFMKGDLDKAIFWYTKSWKSQNIWPQFQHLSFWELLWVNCLKLDWREASLFATKLLEGSKWSRSIYCYQKAVCLLMMDNLTKSDYKTIDNLMQTAAAYKQRIAGKSLPMEKFICRKVVRYFSQNRYLCLPAIELMYLWNVFKVMGKQYNIAEKVFQIIDSQLKQLNGKMECASTDYDNRALCLLLRGACYRQMKNTYLALQDLEACLTLTPYVKEDTYVMPYASVEIALVHIDENNDDLAIAMLEETKKKYTAYSLASRLHFRIHAALMELKEKQ